MNVVIFIEYLIMKISVNKIRNCKRDGNLVKIWLKKKGMWKICIFNNINISVSILYRNVGIDIL